MMYNTALHGHLGTDGINPSSTFFIQLAICMKDLQKIHKNKMYTQYAALTEDFMVLNNVN